MTFGAALTALPLAALLSGIVLNDLPNSPSALHLLQFAGSIGAVGLATLVYKIYRLSNPSYSGRHPGLKLPLHLLASGSTADLFHLSGDPEKSELLRRYWDVLRIERLGLLLSDTPFLLTHVKQINKLLDNAEVREQISQYQATLTERRFFEVDSAHSAPVLSADETSALPNSLTPARRLQLTRSLLLTEGLIAESYASSPAELFGKLQEVFQLKNCLSLFGNPDLSKNPI